MTTAEMLREYSWAVILLVMIIYASLSILKGWLLSQRHNRDNSSNNNNVNSTLSPEKRLLRMRLLSFFAAIAIISFTLIAIINSF